tara:strand:+ start:63 stop:191 length:129 start_codon:yes stop_codon:yes gene_type:complete
MRALKKFLTVEEAMAYCEAHAGKNLHIFMQWGKYLVFDMEGE